MLPEIKCPPHMKLVDREMVPVEYDDAQTKSYMWMLKNGYRCNAAKEGFQAGVEGKTWKDQPFSIITNIIENRRWAEGFERGRKVANSVTA